MPDTEHAQHSFLRQTTLPDGTPIRIRRIRADGAAELQRAFHQLSPGARNQRFLARKDRLTAEELDFLTHADGRDHLALVVAVLDAAGSEVDKIAVARSVRDRADASVAEVAVIVKDEWHRRGVGEALLTNLAAWAWQTGVRRWRAYYWKDNAGIQRLLAKVGVKRYEQRESPGILEAEYALQAPPG